jgi:hypothetical protein
MVSGIILGIDASNIRCGGGVTHLLELLWEEESLTELVLRVK